MRILLVLDRVENPASANALMGFRLAEQLLRRDHTVHILTLWDGLHTPPAPPEGAMQHLLAFADERQMNEALENGQRAARRCRCGWPGWLHTPRQRRRRSASWC